VSKPAARVLLQVALSAVVLAVVLCRADVRQVVAHLADVRLWVLLPAALLCVFDRWVMAFKWRMLLRVRGIHCRLSEVFRLYYVSSFIGSFLPFGVAGDLARGVWMSREGYQSRDVASSIVLERVLGVASSACMAAVCAGILQFRLGAEVTPLLIFSGVLLGGVTLFIAASFLPVLTSWVPGRGLAPVRWMVDVHASMAACRHHVPTLVAFFALTLAEQCLPVAVHVVTARALGLTVPATVFLLTVPIAQMVARMPVSYNGIGVMEGVLAYAFLSLGLSQTQAVSVALLSEIVGMLSLVPAVFMLRSGRKS
jgi:uncharacterized membrane protein YbhN (UPF0104 family)